MSTRFPHLGHTLLFLALLGSSFLLAGILLLATASVMPHARAQLAAAILPLAYAFTLLTANFVFPLVWPVSFAQGIRWNPRGASPWLILAGLALGFVSQAVSGLLPSPKELPIETLLRNPATIWIFAVFGVVLAPLLEEILFRGFVLPALVTAIDYMRLPRSLEALEQWRGTPSDSGVAMILATLITSLLFALIHAPQLGYSWPAVLLLFFVSIVLCLVRLRTRSVAASTLVHASYNLSVFLTLFVTTHAFRHLDRI